MNNTISGGLNNLALVPDSPIPLVTKNFIPLYSCSPWYHFAGVVLSTRPTGPIRGKRIYPPCVCPERIKSICCPLAFGTAAGLCISAIVGIDSVLVCKGVKSSFCAQYESPPNK